MILCISKRNGPYHVCIQYSSKGYELFATDNNDVDSFFNSRHYYAVSDNMYSITILAEGFLSGSNPIKERKNLLLEYAEKDGWNIDQDTFKTPDYLKEGF